MNPELFNSIVLITGSDKYNFGTGFVIYEDQDHTYVITCKHVVNEVGEKEIKVNEHTAQIISSLQTEIDLAVLKVKKLSKAPLNINTTYEKKGCFITAAFYPPNPKMQRIAEKLEGTLDDEIRIGIRLYKGWNLKINDGYNLQKGNSGAPLINKTDQSLIGIIFADKDDGKKGIAISIEHLPEVWPQMPQEIFPAESMVLPSSFNNFKYEYDVFVNYCPRPIWINWIEIFKKWFRGYLEEELAYKPKVYFTDYPVVDITLSGNRGLNLVKSKILVPLWTRPYFNDHACKYELAHMYLREQQYGYRSMEHPLGLIFPAALHDGEDYPERARKIEFRDFCN